MRRYLIAGNWKMHKTIKETEEFFDRFLELIKEKSLEDRDIMIAPPFTALYKAYEKVKGSKIFLGAQNACWAEKGAFTGEISPIMLKELGITFVIVGHSERRHIFGEKDELINKRVKGIFDSGLTPILCVGELLEEREAGKTFEVVGRQLEKGLEGLSGVSGANLVVAYEPVWAIGTGKTATPSQAQEVHQFIREKLGELFGKEVAEEIRILYGGSVKPDNANSILKEPDVDGVLVGGASLDPEKFFKIYTA